MPLPRSRSLALLLALLVAVPVPALGQWIAVGRWGSEQSFRFVPPGTWMVEEGTTRTRVSAEGNHHDGRLTITCTADPGAAHLVFSHYHGTALNMAAVRLSGLPRVATTLAVDEHSFVLHLDASPSEREWTTTLTSPEMLDAMAGGRQMELRTMDGQRVTRIGLSRASAAREALRQGCGL